MFQRMKTISPYSTPTPSLVQPDRENVFIQGEHMRRPSEIRSRLTVEKGDALIRVGGRAVLSLSGEIYAD